MNRISVVTGAGGHIGYALVKELLSRGERPRLLLYLPDEATLFEGMDCEIYMGDITRPETLPAAFEGADVVYHLAGLVEVGNDNSAAVWRVNIDGTQNVVAACKACGVRRLVYVSSVDAIPPAPAGVVMAEPALFASGPLNGAYAKSKAIAAQAALNSAGGGFEVVVAMPGACIGPYDFRKSSVGAMVRMFIHHGFPVTMRFGGYNFVDVRDVAQGLAAMAEKGRSGESYILSGEFTDCDSLIKMLAELTGRRPPRIPLPQPVAEAGAPIAEKYYKVFDKTPLFTRYSIRKIMENGLFSYEKAARELGYNPRGAKESLRDMIDWIKEHEKSEKEEDT